MAEKLQSLVASSRSDGSATQTASAPPPQRKSLRMRIASAWPVLLLLAFLLLLWLLFGDRFASARAVELGPVITLRTAEEAPLTTDARGTTALDDNRYDGETLFQASGWIEAAPFPTRAVTLINGTIDEVYVLQGDTVTKGQLLASLVDEDARLNQSTAEAQLGQSEAVLAEAEAMEESVTASLRTLELNVAAADARLKELKDDSDRLAQIGAVAVSVREIKQAELKTLSQIAVIKALEAQAAELEAQARARRAQTANATHQLALAKTELARKQLALERTQIYSPIDGIIQRLHVAPGMKRMLDMDEPESATIATLYKPDQLQARIDVPLEAAARLSVGQPVRLRSSLLHDRTFEGSVTQIEGQADLQRNTLQAKVIIHDPDVKLRPEMLCRAEFLSTSQQADGAELTGNASSVALYVPIAALVSDSESASANVWKLDASRLHVTQQSITLSGDPREGHRRVTEGLRPGDRVVLNPAQDLAEGERIEAIEQR